MIPNFPRSILLAAAIATFIPSFGAAAAASRSDIEGKIKAGKLDEAIAAGRTAVEAAPADPDLRGVLAHALAAKGRDVRRVVAATVNAEDVLAGKAVMPSVGPDNPPRIVVVYDPALLEDALRHLREAVRLAPRREDLRFTECYLLTDAGDVDRAAVAVRAALEALPRTAALGTSLATFGIERGKRGDPRGGAALLLPVTTAFPADATLAADRGFMLGQAGLKTEALAELDRAAKGAPTDLRVQRRRAAAFVLLREWKRARSAWQAAVEAGHEDGDRLGAAAAAIATDVKTAKTELQSLAEPAASADASIIATAVDLARAASAPAASKGNVALAKKLADEGKELLAAPLLHRALRADPRNKGAAALLAGIERRLGFPSVADEILKNAQAPPPAPKPAAVPAPQTPGASRR